MDDDLWAPPRVMIAVDLVILTLRRSRLHVLLVERGIEPFRGAMALPGGFLADDREDIVAAARRELAEEAGLSRVPYLEQLAVYGEPGRDPRGRVVSIAHLAVAPGLPDPVAGTDAADAGWTPVDEVFSGAVSLAFDHSRIVTDGVERARAKLEYSALATTFCPDVFTISDLQEVYEAVWGVRLDSRNFYRKVRTSHGFVVPAGPPRHAGGAGRPAQVYRAGPRQDLHPPMTRSNIAGNGGPS